MADPDPGPAQSEVEQRIAGAPARYLRQMLLATTFVAVVPLTLSLGLRADGVISSSWLSVALAIALSLGASMAGSAYWRNHGTAGEVLFSELLLWGWIRRGRHERDLANAIELLGLVGPGNQQTVSVDRRTQLLEQLAAGLEDQDAYLNGHSRRVARHAAMIARGMGLPSGEVARIRAAAAVHDVGKLRTPKDILNKPGRLTDAEFEVIKRHPVDGAEMVAALGDPELTGIVRHHHERLDGAGYPDGLAGGRIPVGARIIAVADTFDAITSARPYRAAAHHQKAIDILRREAGTQLDPDAVRSFLAYYSGNRPTAVWAIVILSIRRSVAWLTGDPAAAATISAGKVAAAGAATAMIGVAAGAAPVHYVHPSRPVSALTSRHASAPHRGLAVEVAWTPDSAAHSATHAGLSTTRAIRSRGAHRTAGPAAAGPRRAHRARADHARANSNSAPKIATGNPQATAGASPAKTGNGPSSAGTISNSVAGSSTSGSTSVNPAGQVDQSSSTGTETRYDPRAHATPSGHSGSSNGKGHWTGTANLAAPQSAPATTTPGAPTDGQGGGHGQGSGDGDGTSSSSQGNGAPSSHGNGNGNPQGNSDGSSQGNGNGNSQGNGNGNSQGNCNGNSQGIGNGHGSGTVALQTTPTETPSGQGG